MRDLRGDQSSKKPFATFADWKSVSAFLVNHLLSQREVVRAVRESLPDAKFLSTDLQFPRGVYIVSKIARQQLIRQEEIALFGSWFTGN